MSISLFHGNYIPDSVCAADVNGDGKMDLISANNYGDNFNSTLDGKVDLISANNGASFENGSNSTLTVLTNDGNGGFVLASTPQVYGEPVSLVATDVNGDGKVDLISANFSANTLTVLTNDGSGGFVIASTLNVSSNPVSVCAADGNGDGKVDLICANFGTNTLTVLTNDTIFPSPTSTPPLIITPSGLEMLVSWPSASPGWSLQQNPDLTTANWGPSGYNGYGISDDGTNKSLMLPTTLGNLFFRLLHP